MSLKNIFSAFIFLLFINASNAQVVINEFSCSNINTFVDNYNNYEDWIEIYNSGTSPKDISGYHLSDNPFNPTKFEIPAGTVIPANGILLFIASNKNTVNAGEIHTNFKLTQTRNEVIVLADTGGVVLDSITTYHTQANHSRARITNGGAWGVDNTPTPGTNNTTVKSDYVPKPAMSVAPGFYAAAQSVSMTCPDATAQIRYTTNGSEPTSSSALYSSPINVSTTTIVKAKAFSSNTNLLPSFTDFNTYLINENNHNLPVLSLGGSQFTSFFNSWGNTEIYSSFEYFEKDQTYQFENDGDFRSHGNDSWNFDQKGIRFYTKDEYGVGNNIEYKIFNTSNRDEFDVLIIKAAGSDNYPGSTQFYGTDGAHLRDAFSQTISEQHGLDLDVRRYQPCIVFINGQYWGIYEMRERIDPDYTKYYYNQDKDKVDMLAYWGGLTVEEGSDTGWVNIYNYVMSNNMAIPSKYAYAETEINMMSLIDYFILNTFNVDSDWLNWNTAWWRGRKNTTNTPKVKWRYRLWDEDNTFGLGQNYTGLPTTGPTNDPCSTPTFGNDPEQGTAGLMQKLFDNPEFKAMYINRYSELVNTTFNCDTMLAHLNKMVAVLDPEMQRQCQRWGGNYNTWLNNVQQIRDFITQRCVAINQSMQDCYQVTGPFPVKLNVDPPGSGNIKFNQLNVPYYVYTVNYWGNYMQTLKATPNTGWTFSHWTLSNDSIVPNDTTFADISFLLAHSDSIVAHFIPLIPDPDTMIIKLNVDPVNSGNISINSFNVPYYVYTQQALENTVQSLNATANTGWNFRYWTLSHDTIMPNDTTSPMIAFNLHHNDSIVAHFERIITPPPPPQDTSSTPVVIPTASIPNLFTPNGDGINDYFQFYVSDGKTAKDALKQVNITIYDRWGREVYHSEEVGFAWDGKCKSGACNDGVYYYVLIYTDMYDKTFEVHDFIMKAR